MERERWTRLYRLARELSRGWGFGWRFDTACIVGVFLWAVLHDRPVSWACDRGNWPAGLSGGRLPSQSTMSRRLHSEPVKRLLKLMENAWKTPVSEPAPDPPVKIIDAKPLPIGSYSKDPDSRWGRAAGASAKGYKFYAVWGVAAVPEAWEVYSMNRNEKPVAEELIPRLTGGGWLLGDAQYDSNRLYDLAFEHGHRLLAPRRKKGRFGHHYLSPHRRFAVDLLESGGYEKFRQQRTQIERNFGNWTSFGGGLSPLPSWVRRLDRVRLWIHAKLLINAQRIQQKRLAAA